MKDHKRTRAFYLCLLLFFSSLVSCSSSKKIATLKPEPGKAAPLVYENTYSFINLPVTIKLKDVERITNNSFGGLIYEDKNFEDDDLKMKVWKEQAISITSENGKLKTVLPLKALINYRFSANKFGLPLEDIRNISLSGTITFISDVGLFNWQLRTNTRLKSLVWNEKPSMNVMGQKVPITSLVNPAVSLLKPAVEESIDHAIRESLDFKPNVLDALEKICTPFQMSETYESWLRIIPEELYTTDAVLKDGAITFKMGMKCAMETIIGKEPQPKFNREKIVLKPVGRIPESVTASIAAISTYKDASRILTRNFKGYEFGEGRKKVVVRGVDIWQKDGKIIIALDVTGSVNGIIYLTGYPQYNEITKEVYFDKLDYVLDTKNALLRSAQWLAGNRVLLQLQEKCRYSIEPNLMEGKENVEHYLENYSPMKGVFVNGSVQEIILDKIQLSDTAMVAFIKLKGKVSVTVDGLE
ncbi:DUF4403 family protein [Sinomicrobium weinanense]|uniref:DUF4403 family protein n=1 Tax=Sinomicrobium weinanense TaxID=2842200 RepID=A0A926JND5_9FLAO|nr:DUF4403 family protein [Sinomicrobium weinanense]MBC9794343.1 DUF4403 family protein [Sinomicrobium weinanense]MBU3124250.1 DUF4403 family protein [Sinomicrobium weinanense]